MKFPMLTALLAVSVFPVLAQEPTVVDSTALGRTVSVRGRLGQPLGKLIAIEGAVVEHNYPRTKAENDAVLIRVTKVEGVVLPQPVVIALQKSLQSPFPPSPLPVGPLTLRGYEDGGFTGIPREANKILAYATTDWYFRTEFRVVK